jgi:hypothetical protein
LIPTIRHYTLEVRFASGESYLHAIASDKEAQTTIDAWTRQHGFWAVEPSSRQRVWRPWHTVTEVRIKTPPHAVVLGGSGPAVRQAPTPTAGAV